MSKLRRSAAKEITAMLHQNFHMFEGMENNEEYLNELFKLPEEDKEEDFLMVLRRWNSFTPSMVVHSKFSKGGGYFLKKKETGIVIDPGFNFIENFHLHGRRVTEINAIVVTHAHIDHCVELDSILTLIYEYNDRKGQSKKVDLYLNLGTFKKYGNWLTSCHKSEINKIHILEQHVRMKITEELFIEAASAIHDEIWDNNYSIGLLFYLDGEKKYTIGFTGDTRWSEEIQEQYRNCDVLVMHLGGIKDREIFSCYPLEHNNRLYKNHLGVIGTSHILENLLFSRESKVQLAVISEFGEELKGFRKELVDLIRRGVSRNIECRSSSDDFCRNELNNECLNPYTSFKCGKHDKCFKKEHWNCRYPCIIGDVGTRIEFPYSAKRKPKLKCEYYGCEEDAELEDILMEGEVIAHFCSRHMPSDRYNELMGLV